MAHRDVERERLRCLNLLGLHEGASDDEIRKTYKKLALQHHPDKNVGQDVTEKFQEIGYAYKYLLEGPTSLDTDEGDGYDMPFHILVRLFPWLLGDTFFSRGPYGMFGSSFPGHFYFMESDEDDDFEFMFYGSDFDTSSDEDLFISGRQKYPRTKEEKERLRQQQKTAKTKTKSTKKRSKKQKKKKPTNPAAGTDNSGNPPSYEYYGYTNNHAQSTDATAQPNRVPTPQPTPTHFTSTRMNNPFDTPVTNNTSDKKMGTSNIQAQQNGSNKNGRKLNEADGREKSENTGNVANDKGAHKVPQTAPPQPKKLGKKQKKKLEAEQRRREKEMEAFAQEYLKKNQVEEPKKSTEASENKMSETEKTNSNTDEIREIREDKTQENLKVEQMEEKIDTPMPPVTEDEENEKKDDVISDTKFDKYEFDFGLLMEKKKSKKAMRNERKRQAAETNNIEQNGNRNSGSLPEDKVSGSVGSADYWTNLTESTEDFWGDIDQKFGLNKNKKCETDNIYSALGQMTLDSLDDFSDPGEMAESSWHNDIGSVQPSVPDFGVPNPFSKGQQNSSFVETSRNTSHGNGSGIMGQFHDANLDGDIDFMPKIESDKTQFQPRHSQPKDTSRPQKQQTRARVFTQGGRGKSYYQSQSRTGNLSQNPNQYRPRKQYQDGNQSSYRDTNSASYNGYGYNNYSPYYSENVYNNQPLGGSIYYNSRYANQYQSIPY